MEIRISPARSEDFYRLLVEDSEFRERLTAEPAAVLAEYDIFVSPTEIEDFVELPSPEEIADVARTMSEEGAFVPVGDLRRFWPILWWVFRTFFRAASFKPPQLPQS